MVFRQVAGLEPGLQSPFQPAGSPCQSEGPSPVPRSLWRRRLVLEGRGGEWRSGEGRGGEGKGGRGGEE